MLVHSSKRYKAAKNRNTLFCSVPSDGTSDSTFSAALGFTVGGTGEASTIGGDQRNKISIHEYTHSLVSDQL